MKLVIKSCPATQYADFSTSSSHEYPTIPDAPSRARSRRDCSADVSNFGSVLLECCACMSATQVSIDVATSNTYSELTTSDPPSDLQKTTRAPSGDTTMLRGSPTVSRCVRANCRGNVSDKNVAGCIKRDSFTNPFVFTHFLTKLCVVARRPRSATIG